MLSSVPDANDAYKMFLKTTDGDKTAAAILTLASAINQHHYLSLSLSGDSHGDPMRVNVELDQANGLGSAVKGKK